MADDTTPANKSAERFITQRWSTTREQAIRRLQQFRDVQAESIRRQQLATVQETSAPRPPAFQIQTDTVSFPANPIGQTTPNNNYQQSPNPNGWNGVTTVCIENESGDKVNGIATFRNGILLSVEEA